MTSPSVHRTRVTFRSSAPGSEGQLLMLVQPHQLATLKALVEQWNAANPGHAQPTFSLEVHHAEKRHPTHCIKVMTNQWGNMSGYVSGRRLVEFGSPTNEARDRAKAWMASELDKPHAYISAQSEIGKGDIDLWRKEQEGD